MFQQRHRVALSIGDSPSAVTGDDRPRRFPVTWISGACTAFRAVTTKNKRPAHVYAWLASMSTRCASSDYLLIASCTATATATDAPTIGLLLLPPWVHSSVRLRVLTALRFVPRPQDPQACAHSASLRCAHAGIPVPGYGRVRCSRRDCRADSAEDIRCALILYTDWVQYSE